MSPSKPKSSTSDAVRVVVRVRPLNATEIEQKTSVVIDMTDTTTTITDPSTLGDAEPLQNKFAFDACLWSCDDRSDVAFTDQERAYSVLGKQIVSHAFEGYNASLFAYGQTGSGKTYSMIGSPDDKGVIPRLCEDLFSRVDDQRKKGSSKGHQHIVEVSYLEIYNERVRDLLDPAQKKTSLRVRENPKTGVYVDGLTTAPAGTLDDVLHILRDGNRIRTVGATAMNQHSSRSHAILTIYFVQVDTVSAGKSKKATKRSSKINLIDLAGSERQSKTNAEGSRLKEGANINKSLSELGNVIHALAERGEKDKGGTFIPYRNSTLTWILKDSLGGNARTTMLAALSPSSRNYEETLSTLRYANRAKSIVNKATINEDEDQKIVKELKSEIETLRKQLADTGGADKMAMQAELEEREQLIEQLNKTWEEKLRDAEAREQERQKAMESMGISADFDRKQPHLVNLNEDPFMSEALVYMLRSGETHCGREDANMSLTGLGIKDKHCVFRNDKGKLSVVASPGADVFVNGERVVGKQPRKLEHGDRVVLGRAAVFRVNDFASARRTMKRAGPESAAGMDFAFAMRELNARELADIVGEDTAMLKLAEQERKIKELEQKLQVERKDGGGLAQEKEAEYERRIRELEEEKRRAELKKSSMPNVKSAEKEVRGLSRKIDRLNRELDNARSQLAKHSTNEDRAFREKFQREIDELERRKAELETLAGDYSAHAIFEERLVQGIRAAADANEMARSMSKGVSYEAKVVEARQQDGREHGADVRIRVVDRLAGTDVLVDLDTFQDGLCEMQDVYAMHEGGDESVAKMNPETDPFLFRNAHHHVGTAAVMLQSLAYGLPVEREDDAGYPVFSFDGKEVASIDMDVRFVDENNVALDDLFFEKPEEMLGSSMQLRVSLRGLQGLPAMLCRDVFCTFKFYGEVDATSTKECKDANRNPVLDFEKVFKIKSVSEAFVNFVQSRELKVNVYARVNANGESAARHTAAARSDARTTRRSLRPGDTGAMTTAAAAVAAKGRRGSLASLGAESVDSEEEDGEPTRRSSDTGAGAPVRGARSAAGASASALARKVSLARAATYDQQAIRTASMGELFQPAAADRIASPQVLVKYNRSGKPQHRYVWVDTSSGWVMWSPLEKSAPKRAIRLADVTRVVKERPDDVKAPPLTTIILHTRDKDVDTLYSKPIHVNAVMSGSRGSGTIGMTLAHSSLHRGLRELAASDDLLP